jgi:hypothetical protein
MDLWNKVHFKKCKSSYLFLVKIFLTKVLHLNYFFFGISYIESMQNNPRKIHTQKCIFYKATNKRPIHIFQLQKSNILYLENICYNFYVDFFFIQVENFNLMKN